MYVTSSKGLRANWIEETASSHVGYQVELSTKTEGVSWVIKPRRKAEGKIPVAFSGRDKRSGDQQKKGTIKKEGKQMRNASTPDVQRLHFNVGTSLQLSQGRSKFLRNSRVKRIWTKQLHVHVHCYDISDILEPCALLSHRPDPIETGRIGAWTRCTLAKARTSPSRMAAEIYNTAERTKESSLLRFQPCIEQRVGTRQWHGKDLSFSLSLSEKEYLSLGYFT